MSVSVTSTPINNTKPNILVLRDDIICITTQQKIRNWYMIKKKVIFRISRRPRFITNLPCENNFITSTEIYTRCIPYTINIYYNIIDCSVLDT